MVVHELCLGRETRESLVNIKPPAETKQTHSTVAAGWTRIVAQLDERAPCSNARMRFWRRKLNLRSSSVNENSDRRILPPVVKVSGRQLR